MYLQLGYDFYKIKQKLYITTGSPPSEKFLVHTWLHGRKFHGLVSLLPPTYFLVLSSSSLFIWTLVVTMTC